MKPMNEMWKSIVKQTGKKPEERSKEKGGGGAVWNSSLHGSGLLFQIRFLGGKAQGPRGCNLRAEDGREIIFTLRATQGCKRASEGFCTSRFRWGMCSPLAERRSPGCRAPRCHSATQARMPLDSDLSTQGIKSNLSFFSETNLPFPGSHFWSNLFLCPTDLALPCLALPWKFSVHLTSIMSQVYGGMRIKYQRGDQACHMIQIISALINWVQSEFQNHNNCCSPSHNINRAFKGKVSIYSKACDALRLSSSIKP